jgi:hypothetical protein
MGSRLLTDPTVSNAESDVPKEAIREALDGLALEVHNFGRELAFQRQRSAAILVIEPFETLLQRERDALAEEGQRLVCFVEEGAETFEVQFAEKTRTERCERPV